jgi:Spy/CpxP family protein refolding chaperone
MKKLFTLIFAGALLAGLVSSVSAQGGAGPKGGAPGVQGGQRGPGQGGRGRMAEMMGKIQPPLTADQKKKIEAINKDFRDQIQKLMGGTPGQPPKPGQTGPNAGRRTFDRAKFEPLMKKREEAILKVLNDKQDASYKKLMADMRARRQQGGAGRPGGPPPPGGTKTGSNSRAMPHSGL